VSQTGQIVVGGFNPAIDTLADVESIDIGGVNRLRNVCRDAGGKGLHVAVACATLGASTTLVGPIDASNRPLFEQTLAARNVRFVGVPIDQPIRTCWAIRDAHGQLTELLEPGPLVSNERAATLAASFMREAASARLVVLSGSLPHGLQTDTYARLITALDPARVLLDTSGAPLAGSLAAAPLVVKPNRQEASQIAGMAIETRDDAIRAATRIAARGPRLVLLSLGVDGAIVHEREGATWVVEAPHVAVRNTVGAGDCLLAGFAVSLLRGDTIEQCARFAVACGSAKSMHPEIGFLQLSDVECLLPTVIANRVSVHA
jgi:1-phosphofructokinase family hexose kinase